MITAKDIVIRRTGTDPATVSFYIKVAEEKVRSITNSTSLGDYTTDIADIAICLIRQDERESQEEETPAGVTGSSFSEGGVSIRTDYESGWKTRQGYDQIIQDILDRIRTEQKMQTKVRFI